MTSTKVLIRVCTGMGGLMLVSHGAFWLRELYRYNLNKQQGYEFNEGRLDDLHDRVSDLRRRMDSQSL